MFALIEHWLDSPPLPPTGDNIDKTSVLPSWTSGVIQSQVSPIRPVTEVFSAGWLLNILIFLVFCSKLSAELLLLLDRCVCVCACTCMPPCVDLISWKDGTLDLPHMGFGSGPLAAGRHMTWRHCAHFLCRLFSLWA